MQINETKIRLRIMKESKEEFKILSQQKGHFTVAY